MKLHPSPDCAKRKSGAYKLEDLCLWVPGAPLRVAPGKGAVFDGVRR